MLSNCLIEALKAKIKNPAKVKIHLYPIFQKIKESDFLITDESCVHRMVGLKYVPSRMKEPEVSLICSRVEMLLAKKIAFSLGKKIYHDSKISALLFRDYYRGESIAPRDYQPIAEVYARFQKTLV